MSLQRKASQRAYKEYKTASYSHFVVLIWDKIHVADWHVPGTLFPVFRHWMILFEIYIKDLHMPCSAFNGQISLMQFSYHSQVFILLCLCVQWINIVFFLWPNLDLYKYPCMQIDANITSKIYHLAAPLRLSDPVPKILLVHRSCPLVPFHGLLASSFH